MDKIYKLKNELTEVYKPTTFTNKKNKFKTNNTNFKDFDSFKIYEGFSQNIPLDSSANSKKFISDMSNNLISLVNQAKYQSYEKNLAEIDENYSQLEMDILTYSNENKKSHLYDSIDNSGNLLYNNKENDPTIRDGLLEDTKELLLQQNNIYLMGSFIAASVLVLMVVVK